MSRDAIGSDVEDLMKQIRSRSLRTHRRVGYGKTMNEMIVACAALSALVAFVAGLLIGYLIGAANVKITLPHRTVQKKIDGKFSRTKKSKLAHSPHQKPVASVRNSIAWNNRWAPNESPNNESISLQPSETELHKTYEANDAQRRDFEVARALRATVGKSNRYHVEDRQQGLKHRPARKLAATDFQRHQHHDNPAFLSFVAGLAIGHLLCPGCRQEGIPDSPRGKTSVAAPPFTWDFNESLFDLDGVANPED